MCGRAAVVLTPADLAAAAGTSVPRLPPGYAPRPNVGPGTPLPLVTRDGVISAVWGLDVAGRPAINARSESAASTATWARLLARGAAARGVLVVQGYYEWRAGAGSATSKARQPYFVRLARGDDDGDSDGRPPLLALAALVDTHATPHRFVVVTTAPPPALAFLHDRAPAMLGEAVAANPALTAWLAGATAPAQLRPYEGRLTWHPVTKEVGSVAYQRNDATADAREGGLAAAWAKAGPRAHRRSVKREAAPPPLQAKKRREGPRQASLEGFVLKRENRDV